MSDSLRPHELQHARPPCPSPTPGIHSDSCPSSQWCRPDISSSVFPFFSCPQSLPASESFPMSQLFAWGGQSTGVSALASFLPKKFQGWSPSEWTGWIKSHVCVSPWIAKNNLSCWLLEFQLQGFIFFFFLKVSINVVWTINKNKMDYIYTSKYWASLVAQTVKNPLARQKTWVWSLGGEGPPGGGHGNSSILAWRIPMNTGARRATVHGVAKSQTWLSDFHFSANMYWTFTMC